MNLVWKLNNCRTFSPLKMLQTSTSGVSCTFWISLMTVWTNESICCFFRSLKATSFRSSSIWWGKQITDKRDILFYLLLWITWTGMRPHLHFQKTAVKQAFCLLQLVQLLCCGGSVQVTPWQLYRMVDNLLTRSPLGFASFTFNGDSILTLNVRGFRRSQL